MPFEHLLSQSLAFSSFLGKSLSRNSLLLFESRASLSYLSGAYSMCTHMHAHSQYFSMSVHPCIILHHFPSLSFSLPLSFSPGILLSLGLKHDQACQ